MRRGGGGGPLPKSLRRCPICKSTRRSSMGAGGSRVPQENRPRALFPKRLYCPDRPRCRASVLPAPGSPEGRSLEARRDHPTATERQKRRSALLRRGRQEAPRVSPTAPLGRAEAPLLLLAAASCAAPRQRLAETGRRWRWRWRRLLARTRLLWRLASARQREVAALERRRRRRSSSSSSSSPGSHHLGRAGSRDHEAAAAGAAGQLFAPARHPRGHAANWARSAPSLRSGMDTKEEDGGAGVPAKLPRAAAAAFSPSQPLVVEEGSSSSPPLSGAGSLPARGLESPLKFLARPALAFAPCSCRTDAASGHLKGAPPLRG